MIEPSIIRNRADSIQHELLAIRHHLHAHPELSFEEHETAAYVEGRLQAIGIPSERLASTGVVALINGKNPDSRIVALRADMDALPIREENEVPYKSCKEGVMHACGHDVHTTCLLGAARILHETADQWKGTVKLIFQPGEEKNPGGASLLIKAGVLENPKPQRIYGLHVHPGMEVGYFSFREGKAMASADELYFTIRAKGGHAAAPHLTADPILTAAHLIVSLQQIISRHCDPLQPSVLSITSINGGNTTNVIPAEVRMMGTFRAMDEAWRAKAHRLLQEQTAAICKTMGAEGELHIDIGYPFVSNDPELTANARRLAEKYAGSSFVSETEMRMGAEDFAYYTHQIPGCFFRLGAGNAAAGITSNVHTPTFNIDERALAHGAGMMAWLGAMG